MPHIDTLQIININIDSIDAKDMGISKGNINTSAAQEANTKQETHGAVKCCANTDGISKSTNSSTKSVVDTNTNKTSQQNSFFQVQAMIQTKQKVLS